MSNIAGTGPLVSIVIPVYGVEDYLEDCLGSVAAQTYPNVEVILVDDGSPDGCPAICDRWAARFAHWTVLHLQNGGQSSARNAGLSYAKGELVLFADSDDWIDSALVEDAVSAMVEADADIAMFRFDCASCSGEIMDGDPLSAFPAGMPCGPVDAVRHLLLGHVQSFAWAYLARRSLYEGGDPIRYPVGAYMEDVSTTYKILARASRVCFVDKVFYHYRMRPSSTMGHVTLKLVDNVLSSALGRAAAIREVYPQLELEVKVSLVKALMPDVLYLKDLQGKINKEDYESRYKILVSEIKAVPYREVKPHLSGHEALYIGLIDAGLGTPLLGARTLWRRFRAPKGGKNG